jgi:hypothetical protein
MKRQWFVQPTLKLAYAARMGVLLRNAMHAEVGAESALTDPSKLKSEMDRQLTFDFQSVNVGNLADIAETRWDTLVTKPNLDLLTVSFVYFHEPIKVNLTEPVSEMNYVMSTWQRWDDHVWDWNLPVRQIVSDCIRIPSIPTPCFPDTPRTP